MLRRKWIVSKITINRTFTSVFSRSRCAGWQSPARVDMCSDSGASRKASDEYLNESKWRVTISYWCFLGLVGSIIPNSPIWRRRVACLDIFAAWCWAIADIFDAIVVKKSLLSLLSELDFFALVFLRANAEGEKVNCGELNALREWKINSRSISRECLMLVRVSYPPSFKHTTWIRVRSSFSTYYKVRSTYITKSALLYISKSALRY